MGSIDRFHGTLVEKDKVKQSIPSKELTWRIQRCNYDNHLPFEKG